MFVKTQDPTFASAINVSKFDVITVRRIDGNYKLSVYNTPLKGIHAYEDIATFSSSQQAQMAFDNLMVAIAANKPYWSLD